MLGACGCGRKKSLYALEACTRLDPQAGLMSTSLLVQRLVQECPAALFVNIPGMKAETFATNGMDCCSISKAEAL